MLLPRLITSIVGIPLVVLSIYWGGIPFFALMFVVVFFGLQEYFVLASKGGYSSQPVIGISAGLLIFTSIFINSTELGQKANNQGTAFVLSVLLIPLFFREMVRKNHEKTIERLAVTAFGAFFVSWTLGHLLLMRNLRPAGLYYVIFLFVCIWVLDTGAYFFGVRFGRHKLNEYASPKKTIEGFIGGVVTAGFTALICYLLFLKPFFTLVESVSIGLILSLVAQFSDLSESLLKRDVGVKDSADLLPGHGGMLDRFDSFLFTTPLFYYYLTIFKGN